MTYGNTTAYFLPNNAYLAKLDSVVYNDKLGIYLKPGSSWTLRLMLGYGSTNPNSTVIMKDLGTLNWVVTAVSINLASWKPRFIILLTGKTTSTWATALLARHSCHRQRVRPILLCPRHHIEHVQRYHEGDY